MQIIRSFFFYEQRRFENEKVMFKIERKKNIRDR